MYKTVWMIKSLTENITTFTMFRFNLKIEKKMMDILIKIGVCNEDDKVEDIDLFFRNDDEEEKDKEDDDEEYEENKEKEDEKEQKIKANDEALIKNKDKIRKEEDKKIFKELKNLFKEYALITRTAFRDLYYYYRVIENLYKGYKKNYCKNGIGKLYDKTTTEIISILNKNFLVYEKKLINIVDKINYINKFK